MTCPLCGGTGVYVEVGYASNGEKEPWPTMCACNEPDRKVDIYDVCEASLKSRDCSKERVESPK